jgi:hypothetical protein
MVHLTSLEIHKSWGSESPELRVNNHRESPEREAQEDAANGAAAGGSSSSDGTLQ